VKRITLDPHQFYGRLPLAPHQMLERQTRTEDAIVLCHLGVPRITYEDWSLTVDGLVSSPRTLTFSELIKFPKASIASVHQCAGSPLRPNEPSHRVCNVTWSGARLSDVLAASKVRGDATFVWSTGADFGEFGGVSVDAYVKDLPLTRAASDVLIAYELNEEPLAPEHGFPARLVVPGFYGTNSVKWLTRLTLADRRASSPFTTRWYNDRDDSDAATNGGKPVWAIAPQSLIVSPAQDAELECFKPAEIWGWAWADGGVRAADIEVHGEWQPAILEPAEGRAWQRFALPWTPDRRGTITLASRASSNGETQPLSGRRNAIHRVTVQVR
jgi:DMSO/TMAO reductase YedYZ molybdopterin-dependent catalytic subunit